MQLGELSDAQLVAIQDRAALGAALKAGAGINEYQVQALHRALCADRRAFPTSWHAWAFLLAWLPSVRMARAAVTWARRDDAMLRQLDQQDRSAFSRLRRCAERTPGLRREFAVEPGPKLRPPGRPTETDLRDFFIHLVRREYPQAGQPGAAWRVAIMLAALVWPRARFTADIERDTRRRLKSFTKPKSRACGYFFLLLARVPRQDSISPPSQDTAER